MAEFAELVEGARQRREETRELAAWITSHLMNASGNMKQPVTMDKLLGSEWTVRRIQAEARQKKDQDD